MPIMRPQHAVSQQLRRLPLRYPFLRRVSIVTTIVTLLWIYTIKWGERSVYEEHVDACHWEGWEEWSSEAKPHHLIFIADPQLVDPHTYPGRPWPLSTLTERYTDLYMARNFRLINDIIDPDTIIFLGDLFDGGREWAPETPRKLSFSQRLRLQELGILPSDDPFDPSAEKHEPISKEFVPGENGRWSKWGSKQWFKDFRRFSKIFFEPEQLYPYQGREMLPVYDVTADQISIQNGAENATWQEYATTGGRQRNVITSLPGNHDLGFGPGVQLSVRDRFQSHFGESNRVDVIGNHTFVSLDVLSLSANSFWKNDGFETDAEQTQFKHIWEPAMQFLDDIQASARRAVVEALEEYYSEQGPSPALLHHEVVEPTDLASEPSRDETETNSRETNPKLPVVALSHVPFFRPPETECGRSRESYKAIRIHMGYQYQNTLTQSLSKDIVRKISEGAGEISAAFSGDDHDYCDVTHEYNVRNKLIQFREITVKSFSWAMGVRRPGFLLVSLWNPVDAQGKPLDTTSASTYQTKMCLLPDQLNIFVNYVLLLMFTLLVLTADALFSNLRGGHDLSDLEEVPPSPLPQARPTLPRSKLHTTNGTTNIYSAKPASVSSLSQQSRERGTSISSSSAHNNRPNSIYPGAGGGIQRSMNARTREIVSPTMGFQQPAGSGPLVDRAGYFPQGKWDDMAGYDEDGDSDEEARLGVKIDWRNHDDGKAKWKWRRRTRIPDRLRKPLEVFVVKLLIVGVPVGLLYLFLVRNG